jgi:hypothetical protein
MIKRLRSFKHLVNSLLLLIEITLQLFASWTIAYHLCLVFSLPAQFIAIPFLAILCPLLIFSYRHWHTTIALKQQERRFLGATGLLATGTGLLLLLVSNPNQDDYNFFHRALVQLYHLDQPFILTDTGHNVAGLPPLSALHVATSYEPFVAIGAAIVGIEPLQAYHNLSLLIAVTLLTVTYVLLYQHFGLNQTQSVTATGAALLFMLLDLRLDARSFGNILPYLWVGKVTLWGVLIPVTWLMAERFLKQPTLRQFSLVAMTGICAVGLSGSGLFMIPTLIFAISIAYLFCNGIFSFNLRHAIVLNLASFYCVAIVGASLLGVIASPRNIAAWSEGWATVWWQNLALVESDRTVLIRDLSILLVLPLLSLAKPFNRQVLLLTASLCLVFANPVLGPLWIKVVQPAAYWRLLFLFPLPWCAGLIICPFLQPVQKHYRLLSQTLCVVVGVAILQAHFTARTPWAETDNYVRYKLPWEYRFPAAEVTFAQSISKQLENKNVLAPDSIAVVLALVSPTTKFEAIRGTLHHFANANQVEEGQRRLLAQEFVTTCERTPERETALLTSLKLGVDTVILGNCPLQQQASLIQQIQQVDPSWVEVQNDYAYKLLRLKKL